MDNVRVLATKAEERAGGDSPRGTSLEGLLAARLAEPYASRYAQALEMAGVRVGAAVTIADEDYAALGVPIGHRRAVASVLEEAAAERRRRGHSGLAPETSLGLAASRSSGLVSADAAGGRAPPDGMHKESVALPDGAQWVDVEGSAPSFEAFVGYISGSVLCCGDDLGLYPAPFLRAFMGQNPMPYADHGYAGGGRCAMIVLRLPKSTAVDAGATEMRRLTDLFVLMLRFDAGSDVLDGDGVLLTTVHRERTAALPGLKGVKSRVRGKGVRRWDALVEDILQFVVTDSGPALEAVRQHIESLAGLRISHEPRETVERFMLRGRQAQTLRRSLTANIRALQYFGGAIVSGDADASGGAEGGDGPFGRTMLRAEETLHHAEELEELALDSMNLRMTLINFRFQSNVRLFTYISIVLQPLSLMTGWYGMNWDPFPELRQPHAYFIFIGVAGGVTLLVIALLLWVSSDRGLLRGESEENEAS